MRTSTNIVLFMMLVSATMTFGTAAGVWDDWGVNPPAPGLENQIEKTNDAFASINSGNLGVESFVSAAWAVVQLLKTAYQIITLAPHVLTVIGFPGFVGDLVGTGVYVIWGGDTLRTYLGRDV